MTHFANQLLKIDVNSRKMNWLLLPPLYGLWLTAFGKTIARNQTQQQLFFGLAVLFTLFSGTWLLSFPYLILNKMFDEATLFLLVFLCIIGVIFSYYSIQFERKILAPNTQKATSYFDYYLRFFLLVNWVIGIWNLQKIVREYQELKK